MFTELATPSTYSHDEQLLVDKQLPLPEKYGHDAAGRRFRIVKHLITVANRWHRYLLAEGREDIGDPGPCYVLFRYFAGEWVVADVVFEPELPSLSFNEDGSVSLKP